MNKKPAIVTADLCENLEKTFGKSFFSDVEILDTQEHPLQNTQASIDPMASRIFNGTEEYRFLTVCEGKIIRSLAKDRPKVFNNSLFFSKPLQTLSEHFGANNISLHLEKIDDFSGTMCVGIKTLEKTISKGDILNPALIFKNSPTGKFNPGVSFAFDRVWCSNGARRREVINFDQLNTELLSAQPGIFVSFIEANTEVEFSAFLEMQNKQLKSSFLEKNITQEINTLGFPKKFTEAAHYTIYKECEDLAQPLNAYLAYNGFNKILFQRSDTSMNLDKKEKLDGAIFQYLFNIS